MQVSSWVASCCCCSSGSRERPRPGSPRRSKRRINSTNSRACFGRFSWNRSPALPPAGSCAICTLLQIPVLRQAGLPSKCSYRESRCVTANTPPQGAVERAATVLQPEQDTLGQGRKTTVRKTPETAYTSGISDRAEPTRKALT